MTFSRRQQIAHEQAEGGEDGDLDERDEADRPGKQQPVAVRQIGAVQEAKPERQVEGERDQERVRRQLLPEPVRHRRG